MTYKKITEFVLLKRREQDLTQKELAEKANIHWKTLQNLESDKNVKTNTTLSVLEALGYKIVLTPIEGHSQNGKT